MGIMIKSIFFAFIIQKITKKTLTARKNQNTLSGYKKWSKWNRNINFEIFRCYLYNNSGNMFRIKSILKDLMRKIHFSLASYAEKLKNNKRHFWLQKVVKIKI